MSETVISAQPGWYLVWLTSKKDDLLEYPIIGWRVEVVDRRGDREVMSPPTPITADGTPPTKVWAVRQPDGTYAVPGITDWLPNKEAVVNELIKLERELREKMGLAKSKMDVGRALRERER